MNLAAITSREGLTLVATIVAAVVSLLALPALVLCGIGVVCILVLCTFGIFLSKGWTTKATARAVIPSLIFGTLLVVPGGLRYNDEVRARREAACKQIGAVVDAMFSVITSQSERADMPTFQGGVWNSLLQAMDELMPLAESAGEDFSSKATEVQRNWRALDGNTIPNASGEPYLNNGFSAAGVLLETCHEWGLGDSTEVSQTSNDAAVCQKIRDLIKKFPARVSQLDDRYQLRMDIATIVYEVAITPSSPLTAEASELASSLLTAISLQQDKANIEESRPRFATLSAQCAHANSPLPALPTAMLLVQ